MRQYRHECVSFTTLGLAELSIFALTELFKRRKIIFGDFTISYFMVDWADLGLKKLLNLSE